MSTPDRDKLEMQLSAYLDNELSDAERREVETILARDPAARQSLDELRATVEGLKTLPRAEMAHDIMGELRTRMERRALLGEEDAGPAASPTSSSGVRWLATAAVLAFTCTAGYVIWSFTTPDYFDAGPQYAFNEAKTPSEPRAVSADPAPEMAQPASPRGQRKKGGDSAVPAPVDSTGNSAAYTDQIAESEEGSTAKQWMAKPEQHPNEAAAVTVADGIERSDAVSPGRRNAPAPGQAAGTPQQLARDKSAPPDRGMPSRGHPSVASQQFGAATAGDAPQELGGMADEQAGTSARATPPPARRPESATASVETDGAVETERLPVTRGRTTRASTRLKESDSTTESLYRFLRGSLYFHQDLARARTSGNQPTTRPASRPVTQPAEDPATATRPARAPAE